VGSSAWAAAASAVAAKSANSATRSSSRPSAASVGAGRRLRRRHAHSPAGTSNTERSQYRYAGSAPKENIKSITEEFDRDLVSAPREGLDFLCIADLGTWGRVTTVLTERFLLENPHIAPFMGLATATSARESVVLSGMRHDYKQENLSPLTNFIGLLWNKLALNDFSLKPIADGLRVTETTDTTGSFGMRSYKFADVTTPQIAAQWRNHGPYYY
jgi:hypothetical protein